MIFCVACGLPAPNDSTACAYCGQHYNAPCTFELVPGRTSFIWRTAAVDLAEARIEDGIWRLYAPSAQRPQVSMLAIRRESRYTVALLDQDLNKLATVIVRCDDFSSNASKRFLAVVNDDSKTNVVVHGDGPTGYHLVDRFGEILAIASPREGFVLAGFDVLLTASKFVWKPLEIFGILFSIVLANVSDAKCNFADIDHLCLDSSEDFESSGPTEL